MTEARQPPLTASGFLAADDGQPLALYRGTVPGEDDIGGVCPVTGKILQVMWFTSCPENAEFFADGEVQRCLVRLDRPLIFAEGDSPRCGPGPFVASIDIHDEDGPDGVIFRDIVDGACPSDIYAVFPRGGTIAHAVTVIGRKTYDDEGVAHYSGEPGPEWVANMQSGNIDTSTSASRPRMNPDPAALSTVLHDLVAEYGARGVSSWDIGNGECEDFATEALRRWAGDDFREGDGSPSGDGFQMIETMDLLMPEDDGPSRWDWDLLGRCWGIRPPDGVDPKRFELVAAVAPSHMWIAVGGRHYDADAPGGVDSFLELPFFQRWLGLRDTNADRDAARAAVAGA